MTSQEIHEKAIGIADVAFIKKFNGFLDEAKQLFSQAYELEKQALEFAKAENLGEPTISVLIKSVGSFKLNCN